MRNIIRILILILILTDIAFSQSIIDYQSGSSIEIQTGAGVCADQVIINGNFTGGGTICGGAAFVLNLKVLIQGFYNSSSNKMVSDTARIYLRNTTAPYAIVDSSISLLDSTGTGIFHFDGVVNGSGYYIVFRHRNSIETWSSTAGMFVSNSMMYDFTSALNKAFGNNQVKADNTPDKFAVYSGDVNQDGIADATDLARIDNDTYNFATGYISSDADGNNLVDASDAAIVENNAYNFVSRITP